MSSSLPLEISPRAVMDAITGAHVIDARATHPGIVEVVVSPGHDRAAVASLLQAGYDATRRGDRQTVVVVLPETEEPDVCAEHGAPVDEARSGSSPGFTGARIYFTTYTCGCQDVDGSADNADAAR